MALDFKALKPKPEAPKPEVCARGKAPPNQRCTHCKYPALQVNSLENQPSTGVSSKLSTYVPQYAINDKGALYPHVQLSNEIPNRTRKRGATGVP